MNASTDAETILSLTPSASEQVKTLLAREAEGDQKHLRVFVEDGGCSGMKYGLVFDERRSDDLPQVCDGVTVLVDPYSSEFLRGTVVDFVDELNGGGFKIRNPNARQTCGCGSSFTA